MALEVEPSDAGQRARTVRILAIDQGTSATKAVVFGEDGDVVTSVEAAVTPQAVPGGGVEQDPEQLWESVCEAGREAVARTGAGVTAVGFANQGETVLAWDRETGRPLSTAISWQDRRSAAICDDMAGAADDLTRTTGLPLDPYFAAPKMTWLRRNVTTEGVVTTSDAWLLHRLTGSYVTDVTTASRTLLLDLGTRDVVGRGVRRLRPRRGGAPGGGRQCPGDRRHGCLRAVSCRYAGSASISRRPWSGSTAWSPGSRSAPTARGPSSWPMPGRGPSCRPGAWPSRWPGSSATQPPTASTGRSMPPEPPSPGCNAGGSCDGPRISMPSPAQSTTTAGVQRGAGPQRPGRTVVATRRPRQH